MSISFSVVENPSSSHSMQTHATFALGSPWQDISLVRALLSCELDHRLPKPVDWSTAPGSQAGVEIYRSYARLIARWADERETNLSAFDRFIDPACDLVVYEDREEVVSKLDGFVELARSRDHLAFEITTAMGVTALCHLLTPGAAIRRKRRPTVRKYEGPIYYYTAALEGFDEIRAVRVSTDG